MKSKNDFQRPPSRLFGLPFVLIVAWLGLKLYMIRFPRAVSVPMIYPLALFMTSDIQWFVLGGLALLGFLWHRNVLNSGVEKARVLQSLALQGLLMILAFGLFFSNDHTTPLQSIQMNDQIAQLVGARSNAYTRQSYTVLQCDSIQLMCHTYATVNLKRGTGCETQLDYGITEPGKITLRLNDQSYVLDQGEEEYTLLCGRMKGLDR